MTKDNWIQGGAVVLEMSDIPSSTSDTELSLPSPTSSVLLLDKRRQQALSMLQSVLKEQTSHEELQEQMLTKAIFCSVFQRAVYTITNIPINKYTTFYIFFLILILHSLMFMYPILMMKDVLRLLFQLLDYHGNEKLVQANLMDLFNDNLKQAG